VKLRDFMVGPELCGPEFLGPSWVVHRDVIAPLWDGDAHLIPPDMLPIAHQLLGCEVLPREAPQELYLAFGRRSGKTRFEAVAGVHAWAQDYRQRGLARGEIATISCHCPTAKQAQTWLGYCRGLIEASPVLREAVANDTNDSIESTHGTKLEVFTSNFRSARGYSMPLAIIDEASFLRDEFSANPDKELRRALLPALATLRGRLLVASSLHRRAGLMFDMHRKHFAQVAA
jgi:hypothetical protein